MKSGKRVSYNTVALVFPKRNEHLCSQRNVQDECLTAQLGITPLSPGEPSNKLRLSTSRTRLVGKGAS